METKVSLNMTSSPRHAASRGADTKPDLARIGIFGANGHIGRPMARFIAERSPKTGLRLFVRNEGHVPALRAEFPDAEVVVANYYDLASMEAGFAGLQGLFIVTPNFLDEERAMTNLVYAARTNPGILHIVRVLGDPPGMTLERVPDALRRFGGGTATQHLRAKPILERSGLPVTYLNIASYFMQNFLTPLYNRALRGERRLAIPSNRRMCAIDTADIGACAAAILLSPNQRQIGLTYHLDNGHDMMWFDEVAEMMSEVFGEEITYDGSDETFLRLCGDDVNRLIGRPDAAQYALRYFRWEQDIETIWVKSDIVEHLTGRPATPLRDWLTANRQAILG